MAFKMLPLLLFFAVFIFINSPIEGKYLLVEVNDVRGKLCIAELYLNDIVMNTISMIEKSISI